MFATLLSASQVRSAVEVADILLEESGSTDPPTDVCRVGLYRDVVTEVTLVHVHDRTPTRNRNTQRAQMAHEILVACARSEVDTDIGLLLGTG